LSFYPIFPGRAFGMVKKSGSLNSDQQ